MRSNSTGRTTAVGVATALITIAGLSIPLAAHAATPHRSVAASKKITCSTSSSGKNATFYKGKSASYAYDARFSAGASVPGLPTHTPQGLARWTNWDGKGHNLFLVAEYRSGSDTLVQGIDASSRKYVNTVLIANTHGGGIAISRGWIFISGSGTSIRKYRASTMRAAFASKSPNDVYVKSIGTPRNVHGASFLTSVGNYLYAGKFNSSGRDRMYRYAVASSGKLTTGPGYDVPTKTQGAVVTGGRFIFSTSYGRHNRGNIYVVKQGYKSLDSAKLKCFRSPSMNEGITVYGSRLFVVFESGSYEYYKTALNPISRLHKASLSSLTSLV